MAFEGLTEKLTSVFNKLRGKGHLSEADVNALLKQFGMMQTLTKQMSRGKMPRGLKGLLGGGGGFDMNALGDMGRGGFGMGAHSAGRQRKSNKRKKKKR